MAKIGKDRVVTLCLTIAMFLIACHMAAKQKTTPCAVEPVYVAPAFGMKKVDE